MCFRPYSRNSLLSADRSDDIGLTAYSLGGIDPGDIELFPAFDVTEGKVGKDLSEAIYAEPNNTPGIIDGLDKLDVRVEKGSVLDGLGKHYLEKIKVSDAPKLMWQVF